MMTLRLGALIAAIAIVWVHQSLAQDLVIYPAQDQSAQQMDQDKFECYGWARDQTGFDPMQAPPASAPAPQQQSVAGGVAKGALVGGLTGLAIGAIADDAGKGTAIGAIGGGVIGGLRRSNQNAQQQQAAQQQTQQQSASYEAARATYNRNYAACLEGRGYTVR
jgi:hypothetical protein